LQKYIKLAGKEAQERKKENKEIIFEKKYQQSIVQNKEPLKAHHDIL
jgi:hypothetical protein